MVVRLVSECVTARLRIFLLDRYATSSRACICTSFLDHQRLSRVVMFLMRVTTNSGSSTSLVPAPDGSAKHNGRSMSNQNGLVRFPCRRKVRAVTVTAGQVTESRFRSEPAAQNQLMHELDESVPCLAGCLDLVDLLSGCVKCREVLCRVVSHRQRREV